MPQTSKEEKITSLAPLPSDGQIARGRAEGRTVHEVLRTACGACDAETQHAAGRLRSFNLMQSGTLPVCPLGGIMNPASTCLPGGHHGQQIMPLICTSGLLLPVGCRFCVVLVDRYCVRVYS